jgi:hypothetical protein
MQINSISCPYKITNQFKTTVLQRLVQMEKYEKYEQYEKYTMFYIFV